MADEESRAGTPSSRSSSRSGNSGSFSLTRAALILVAFVIATLVLVAVGTRPSVIAAPTAAPSTTSTTAAHGATTTTVAGASTTTTTKAAHTTTTTKASHSDKGHKGGATTTTTTEPHGNVSVVVANATSTNGLAAHYSTVISAGGWSMQTPIDANSSEATSAVYYAAGQQGPAASIATTIGVTPTAVLPLTSSTPVTYAPNTDVVVVIGADLAASAGA